MQFIFNYGGRKEAGFKGAAGDCVMRAISIATEKPYLEVYDTLKELASKERITKRRKRKSSIRDGVHKITIHKYLKSIDWKWTPMVLVGQGCKIHLKEDELPEGRIIVSLSKHYCAIIDKVINDTHFDDRNGTRCVYGIWSKE